MAASVTSIPRVEPLPVAHIRLDFPILQRQVHGHRLGYLDNAATTQKPTCVIEALVDYYRRFNANIHRGLHTLAEEATTAYESVREKVARFLGGVPPECIVFTRNTTEAINLVAYAWARRHLRPGDAIVLTEMEHHSNLVPWLRLAQERSLDVRFAPITDEGYLDWQRFVSLLDGSVKLVAFTALSNVLGTINPVPAMIEAARAWGACVLIDGAQSVPHSPTSVRQWACDFLAFSAHKMLGPTGVGVLYARPERLEEMDPFLGGGEMVHEVHYDRVTYKPAPWKFEAGTPNIADVIAFGSALDYLEHVGMGRVRAHELELTRYALDRLGEVGNLRIFGPRRPEDRGGVIAFDDPLVHPHDLSTVLDQYGIAIRAGHHCAQPLTRRLGVVATARASFYLYNGRDDVDALIEGLHAARRYFGHGNASAG